ncbi:hypothetical protein T484DRAFT_1765259 [Baffinella frigidus]|nr:hypothetical protein T484DRAFT_1765259 [Cryptophyta sp. CCMP2293]
MACRSLVEHEGRCPRATIECPNEGCTESLLRKDLPGHEATCEHRVVNCRHCWRKVAYRSLAEHEGRCPLAEIECPNEGCGVRMIRGHMNLHRERCLEEEVACPCPKCDARLLRKQVNAHVRKYHMQKAEKQLQRAWGEVAKLKALSESEQHHAAASPTSWVFNWRAAGWGVGVFKSEVHTFGEGAEGFCILQPPLQPPSAEHSSTPQHSHFIGFRIEGLGKCKAHATFSFLDQHDKTLREVIKLGTATAPFERDFSVMYLWGQFFTPTAEERAQSVRADGSIRLRAVVRLFLDGAV